MKYTKEILENIVRDSKNVSDVIRQLGLPATGSNHRYIKARIDFFDINISHFIVRRTFVKSNGKIHFSEILVDNRLGRREQTSKLRRVMCEFGFKELCEECGIGKIWNKKPIRLQIDHRDGDGLNNQFENLRFLCPNCHSQTDNYAIKNAKFPKKQEQPQISNDKKPSSKRPEREILEAVIFQKPSTEIAKDFGVSSKAVEKWCKFYGIQKPSRGYWSKFASRV